MQHFAGHRDEGRAEMTSAYQGSGMHDVRAATVPFRSSVAPAARRQVATPMGRHRVQIFLFFCTMPQSEDHILLHPGDRPAKSRCYYSTTAIFTQY
eukprot:gene19116-biopygen17473